MGEKSLYNPKYEAADIFKALKDIKPDELLPEDGPLEFFYLGSQYPGVSLFLRDKKKIKFFYIDHEDFILEVKDKTPEWHISADNNLVRISLINKVRGATPTINFVFDIADKGYRELLDTIRKDKEIELYYLLILYGGLVLDSVRKYKIPSDVMDVLKKIK
ncbi:MAG: hypothetical protein FWH53_05435 [Leptospirales bacterium]|nr:hypothetical protein [Leptospirales bacterium]